jgi:hypothetical protein
MATFKIPKLIMNTTDPIETTITYDHSEKTVMGWTNDRTIMNLWRTHYPSYITDNKRFVELRCPMSLIASPKLLKPRMRRNMSEEQKQAASERLRKMHQSKTVSAG